METVFDELERGIRAEATNWRDALYSRMFEGLCVGLAIGAGVVAGIGMASRLGAKLVLIGLLG